jgi:TonB family protein
MTPVETNVSTEPKAAPPARKPAPSLLSRCSGTVVSLLVHGGFVLAAFLSVAAPRTGRGGGIVGTPEGGPGEPSYSALVQRSDTVTGERQADVRAFEAPTDEPVAPEAVPPPELDFLNEPAETGVPVAKLPPRPEIESHARSKGAYSKLPPSTGSEDAPAENPAPTGGNGPKGNSNVSGTGGDTGGAGDGTVGALYMPAPEYPSAARRKGIEGIVVVTIDVLPDGACAHAQIVESSGCEALDDAALAAIRKWKYESHPAEPPSMRRVRFVFRLQR